MSPMSNITESEGYTGLAELFGKYKKFAFDKISLVPYGSIPSWIAFADDRVEDALREKRGVWQNVKDFYAIFILGKVFALIAFWHVFLLLGGLLITAIAFLGAFGLLLNPALTIAVAAGLLALIILYPGVSLLLRSVYFHIIMKLLGAKGSFSDTMSVIVMMSGSAIVLMVPMCIAYAIIVGFLFSPLTSAISIYSAYLMYKGMLHVHSMAPKNAAIAVVGGILLEIGIMFAIYLAVYAGLMAFRLAH